MRKKALFILAFAFAIMLISCDGKPSVYIPSSGIVREVSLNVPVRYLGERHRTKYMVTVDVDIKGVGGADCPFDDYLLFTDELYSVGDTIVISKR